MEKAVLISISNNFENIHLTKSEFSLGRGINNSYVFNDLTISRCHCIFTFKSNLWIITDKSTNGTKINSKQISKNNFQIIENNDIIELTDTVKYKFCYPSNVHQTVCKKRRLDSSNNSQQSPEPKKFATSKESEINKLELSKLQSELSREKAIIQKLKCDSKEMQTKIFGLEVDLFNKIASCVKLEQEIIDFKSNCANLEKEREELLLQLAEYESETNLLRQRLEKNVDKSKKTTDELDEDKNLLCCVLKAEINEKKCALKIKFQNAISTLRQLRSNDGAVEQIQKFVSELQSDINELVLKITELDSNVKVVEPDEEKTKDDLFNRMENDLQCSICSEIFIKATSLNCGHTFCKICILRWKQQKKSCPVCRVSIKNLVPCIALDNYVDQTVESLSPSKKEMRFKLKESHEASTSNLNNLEKTSPNRITTISVSSDDSESDWDLLDSDGEDFSESSDHYYGGYGACFICGSTQHWANACPRRRRRRY